MLARPLLADKALAMLVDLSQLAIQTTIKQLLATGRHATTIVPLPFDLTSRVPPNCRSLSRIPLIPTPGVPPEFIELPLFLRYAFPLSATSSDMAVRASNANLGD